MAAPDHLPLILDPLPDKPVCYLMKDRDGTVISVGKAVNLSVLSIRADRAFGTRFSRLFIDHSRPSNCLASLLDLYAIIWIILLNSWDDVIDQVQ